MRKFCNHLSVFKLRSTILTVSIAGIAFFPAGRFLRSTDFRFSGMVVRVNRDLFRLCLVTLHAVECPDTRGRAGRRGRDLAFVPAMLMFNELRIERYAACRRFRGSADILLAVFIRPAGKIVSFANGGLGLFYGPACPVAGHYIPVIVFPGDIHHNR